MFGVPTREVKAALYHQKRGYYKAVANNVTNRYRLFSIARLNSLWSPNPIGTRNDYPRPDYTHYEARLVEVIEIGIRNTVFRPYINN